MLPHACNLGRPCVPTRARLIYFSPFLPLPNTLQAVLLLSVYSSLLYELCFFICVCFLKPPCVFGSGCVHAIFPLPLLKAFVGKKGVYQGGSGEGSVAWGMLPSLAQNASPAYAYEVLSMWQRTGIAVRPFVSFLHQVEALPSRG